MFKATFVLVVLFSCSLNAMIVPFKHGNPQDLAAQIIQNGDNQEKEQARSFLENRISGPEFMVEVQRLQDIKRRRAVQVVQLAREQHTQKAIDNLLNSVERAPYHVEEAFAQIDEARSHYSWHEQWFGANIITDPENSSVASARIDSAFYALTECLTDRLFSCIAEKCKGLLAGAIITTVQSRYDVKSKAQYVLLHDHKRLTKNADAFNAFLRLGIKPYTGWNLLGERADFMFGASCFSESALCNDLISDKNAPALHAILTHFPSFATKNLLHKIVARDNQYFDLLRQIYPTYRHLNLSYPEFPHECMWNYSVGAYGLNDFLEWASHNFNVNYQCKPGYFRANQTVLDSIGYRITQAERMAYDDVRKNIAAMHKLLNYHFADSADPHALTKAIEIHAQKLAQSQNLYCLLEAPSPAIKAEKDQTHAAMINLISALKQRFNIKDPQSVIIDMEGQ